MGRGQGCSCGFGEVAESRKLFWLGGIREGEKKEGEAYAKTAKGPIGAPFASLYWKLGFGPCWAATWASNWEPRGDEGLEEGMGGKRWDIADE